MSRRFVRGLIVGAATGTVALGALVWWFLIRTPSEQPFYDYVASLKARGEPTTFEELAGPAPPDAENAAPEIEAALHEVEHELGQETRWPMGVVSAEGVCFPPAVAAGIADAKALADFADGLKSFADHVDDALRRPQCRWAPKVHADGSPDETELDVLRPLVLLLDARARFARDVDARLQACRLLARVADRLKADTWEKERHAGAAVIGCATALREGLSRGVIDPRAARVVLEESLSVDRLPRIQAPLRWGSVSLLSAYASLLDGRRPSHRERLGLSVSLWEGAKRVGERVRGRRVSWELERGTAKDIVAFAKLYRDAADLPTESFPRFHARFHELKKAADLDWMSENACDLAFDFVASDARLRLARVALALGEYRATHVDFPNSLDELRDLFKGGVPLDPYTDGPFRYEPTSTGARVWSPCRDIKGHELTFDEAFGYVLAWDLKR